MIESCYLAGPMRNLPRFGFDVFEAAMKDLQSRGITVISPHKMDLDLGFNPDGPLPEGFLDGCVLRDVDAIIKTGAVVFLPGWKESKGATGEYHVARWLGRPCYNYPDLSLIPDTETILEEAQRLVYGARQASYGHPKSDFSRTAKIWSAILGAEVTASQVGLCMIGVKISRECNAHKRDTVTDIAGYAATIQMLHE